MDFVSCRGVRLPCSSCLIRAKTVGKAVVYAPGTEIISSDHTIRQRFAKRVEKHAVENQVIVVKIAMHPDRQGWFIEPAHQRRVPRVSSSKVGTDL